jgi:hypothetical protein
MPIAPQFTQDRIAADQLQILCKRFGHPLWQLALAAEGD